MTKEFHKIQGQLGLESARLVWATSKVISQTNKQKKVKQIHIKHEQKNENNSISLDIFIIIA